MPNGNSQPSGLEVEALIRRSALLAAKVTSLEDNGFSRPEAMQILFADIETGLTEFGTPTPGLIGISAPQAQPPPSLDLSTLIGSWNITPASLREVCTWGGLNPNGFRLEATSLDISAQGQGNRFDFVFRDAGGSGTRAEGQLSSIGGSRFDFVGVFEQSGVRLRTEGNVVNGDVEVTFTFEYKGTPLDFPLGLIGISPCSDSAYPRTLVRI